MIGRQRDRTRGDDRWPKSVPDDGVRDPVLQGHSLSLRADPSLRGIDMQPAGSQGYGNGNGYRHG